MSQDPNIETLNSEFPFEKRFIQNLIYMATEGNTVPFIARYRKEQTGAMDEIQIRAVLERFEYLTNLEKRKDEVIRLIDERGKLTEELKRDILNAKTLNVVEDLYAPYKSKKKTKADIAKEAGLEPLADYIKQQENLDGLNEFAAGFINEQVADADTAVSMARDIITESIGHDINIKNRLRTIYQDNAVLSSEKAEDTKERNPYEAYYGFKEKISTLPPHRVMAIFRGEKEKFLKIDIAIDEESCNNAIVNIFTTSGGKINSHTTRCIQRAMKTMLLSSIELEARGTLRDIAEERAIQVFADNLKSLILTPPVKDKIILGLDPAFRTGCKFAVVDDTGKLLDHGVMYPTEPHNDYKGSKKIVMDMIKKHKINLISIGNGTASRETEEFAAQVITEESLDIPYTITNEAGASVYSASEIAAHEFPELDVTIRGAISIARRVLDPLAELVKIEPRSIGVGMYQHDVNKKKLESTLGGVVEDVVNNVGVNLNTASSSLLKYVAGLNSNLADRIVKYREKEGKFKSREDLLRIAGIGESIYRQCAGFLKIYEGKEPLDAMFIHPENYEAVYNLLSRYNLSPERANMIRLGMKGANLGKIAKEIGVGEFTMKDIVDNLEKPDRDIRDNVDPIMFKKGVVNLESLTIGTVMEGKVTNVVDFGAFIDIGLKNDGLAHISELANKFIKHPKEAVSVGMKVKAKVIGIDKERGRVSLSLKV